MTCLFEEWNKTPSRRTFQKINKNVKIKKIKKLPSLILYRKKIKQKFSIKKYSM